MVSALSDVVFVDYSRLIPYTYIASFIALPAVYLCLYSAAVKLHR